MKTRKMILDEISKTLYDYEARRCIECGAHNEISDALCSMCGHDYVSELPGADDLREMLGEGYAYIAGEDCLDYCYCKEATE